MIRDVSNSHDSEVTERPATNTGQGVCETFKISLRQRLAWTLFVALGISLVARGTFWIWGGVLTRSGGTDLDLGLLIFLCIMYLSSLVAFGLSIWRTQIQISEKGVSYTPGGICRSRLIPWQDIIAVRWKRGVSHIVLADGNYIEFSGLANQERLANGIRSILARLGRRDPWTQLTHGFRETFRMPRSQRDTHIAGFSICIAGALGLLIIMILEGPGPWTAEMSIALSFFVLVATTGMLLSMRAYRRVRIELSDEGIRTYDIATGHTRSSVLLNFRSTIPWSEIVAVRQRKRWGDILLANGHSISLWSTDTGEILLHLIEAKLEMLEKQGRKAELNKLKKSAIVGFIAATLIFSGIVTVTIFLQVRVMQ